MERQAELISRWMHRKTVSSQPHELEYVYGVLQDEFPKIEREEIVKAVDSAKQNILPSSDREKMMTVARRILGYGPK